MKLDLNDFIEKFAAQFYETERSEFTPSTVYKELDEWSSLNLINLIAMIDSEYGVTLDGYAINKAETIQDLFSDAASRIKVKE